ncbi:MAG: DUF2585 family protein [Planctomycetales bacterium]|nr:DUF2585 family protein [Planctomycetales bacterium]
MADATEPPRPVDWRRLLVIALIVASAQATLLAALGRRWWCVCGQAFPYTNKPVGQHTSQHLLDPYSWSHFQHGLVLFPLIRWLAPRRSLGWVFAATLAIEAGWELLENSPWIIERYRNATAAVGYTGDTIVNSLADLACCALGFFVARRLGLAKTIALFAAIEVGTIAVYRDSLLLNVIMLLTPIDAIKQWQQAAWG